jgi:adenylate cyclase
MASDHDLAFWRPYGVFFEGCLKAAHGAQVEGLDEMRRGLTLLSQQNATLFVPFLMLALAQAEARTGDIGRALATLDEGLAASGRTSHHAFDAELYRARGEVLLERHPSNPAPAEEAFQAPIAIAEHQGMRSFGLRAALSLAKLYQSNGRPADAHAVLAPALEGFSPTPEMPEIEEGEELLAAWSARDGFTRR